MILVVSLNPALDVTYHVAEVDWSGVNRPHEVAAAPGGKGLNVARTLRAHLGHDMTAVAAAAEAALAEPLPAALTGARHFTFLGTGWSYGLANEAALKLREAAGMWTESYPAMEYRHGPISVTGPGSVVWLLGRSPDGLADEVAAAGGLAWQSSRDPLAELVLVQRLAAAVARARGLDPDRPRNLNRSVILAPR